MPDNRMQRILGPIAVIAYLLYHALVDISYRPNADDFAGMYYASKGIPGIGYAVRFYFEWEGPFLSMIVQGLWMKLLSIGVSGGLIISIIKAGLLASSMFMFNGVYRLLTGKGDLGGSMLAGAAFCTAMYLASSAQDEVWHWVMGTVVYLHPIIALQIGVGLLLRKRFGFVLIPFIYIMQSRATYAVLFLGLISLVTAVFLIQKKAYRRKMLMANVILLGAFLIYLLAPGNSHRVSNADFGLAHYIYEYSKEIRNVFVSYNLAKLDRVFLGLMAFLPLMVQLNVNKWKLSRTQLILPAIAYLAFVLVHAAVFVAATGYSAWPRVISMHTFIFSLVCGFYLMILIKTIKSTISSKQLWTLVSFVSLLALILRLYWPLPHQMELGSQFSRSYDERFEMIFQFKGNENDVLLVEKMPPAGVLHYWEFSNDPEFWINKDFRTRYQLPFRVAVADE